MTLAVPYRTIALMLFFTNDIYFRFQFSTVAINTTVLRFMVKKRESYRTEAKSVFIFDFLRPYRTQKGSVYRFIAGMENLVFFRNAMFAIKSPVEKRLAKNRNVNAFPGRFLYGWQICTYYCICNSSKKVLQFILLYLNSAEKMYP